MTSPSYAERVRAIAQMSDTKRTVARARAFRLWIASPQTDRAGHAAHLQAIKDKLQDALNRYPA